MAFYKIGNVILKRRIDLNLTQEELSFGICSVSTLSKIENGERYPNKKNFDALMQRLGGSVDMYNTFVSENDFLIHEKKFFIRQNILRKKYNDSYLLLKELKSLVENEQEKLHTQFILYIETYLYSIKNGYTEKILKKMLDAIKITIPNFTISNISNYILTFDEIFIISNIANVYGHLNKCNYAIDILIKLKEFLESEQINTEEIIKTYPLVLHSLSDWLKVSRRYLECIDICDRGIQFCCEISHTMYLSDFYFFKGYCMLNIENSLYIQQIYDNFKLAYFSAISIGDIYKANYYFDFFLSIGYLI